MRNLKPFKSARIRPLVHWSFPSILLIALVVAMTAPWPDRALRAESAPQTPLGQAQPALADPTSQAVPAAVLASSEMLGISGRLRAVMATPDVLAEDPVIKPLLNGSPTEVDTADWPKLKTAGGDPVTVVPLVPFEAAGKGSYAKYNVGSWPTGAQTVTSTRYARPEGFIGVTRENQETSVSESFKMRDFLTHDQGDVWPKVLVIRPTLLDKLELIRAELENLGLPSKIHVMSGFRTPQYNARGVGKGGRAKHSRHMYGDAADVFVDADGNGNMDDLNRDGRITVADAQVLRAAAERVEAKYPELVGGLSAYPANSAHGPFVHVDARGVKARW